MRPELEGGRREEAQVDKLVELFEADCYINRKPVLEGARTRGMLNIIHDAWIIKADFVFTEEKSVVHCGIWSSGDTSRSDQIVTRAQGKSGDSRVL